MNHTSRVTPQYVLVILAFLLALVTHGVAQEYVVTTYALDSLNEDPGELVLSPNYLTLLEFPDLVETVATGRADLIQVEVDDNRILLRPTRGNGSTDLIVKVAGVNALFRIDIQGENGTPRRYVVDTSASNDEASGNGDVGTMPAHTMGIGTTPVTGEEVERPAPFEFTYSARLNENGRLTVYYTLANHSTNPITNDGTRLTLLDDMGEIEYSIVRMNPDGTPNRLMPGTSEHGVMTAERSVFGDPRIEWPIVEQGPGKTYIINELVVDIEHE